MITAIIISFAITFILILKNKKKKKPFPDVYLKINENCKKFYNRWWFF